MFDLLVSPFFDSQGGQIKVRFGGTLRVRPTDKSNREGEIITVAGSGAGAGYVQYWDVPIFANDCFTVKGNKNVYTKYLFYCLENVQEKIYATKKGGGVPHVHISDIENFFSPSLLLLSNVKLSAFWTISPSLQPSLQPGRNSMSFIRSIC